MGDDVATEWDVKGGDDTAVTPSAINGPRDGDTLLWSLGFTI